MTKLWALRHAETIYKSTVFAGNVDIPLSSSGVRCALSLSPKIKLLNPDIVFASKLMRTTETALLFLSNSMRPIVRTTLDAASSCISKGFIPLIEVPALDERNYGVLQNKSKQEAIRTYGEDTIRNWRRNFYASPPGGESLADVTERVQSFVDNTLYSLIPNNNIMIVAHQNSIRSLLYLLSAHTPETIEHVDFSNCDGVSFSFNQTNVINHEIISWDKEDGICSFVLKD